MGSLGALLLEQRHGLAGVGVSVGVVGVGGRLLLVDGDGRVARGKRAGPAVAADAPPAAPAASPSPEFIPATTTTAATATAAPTAMRAKERLTLVLP